MPQQNFPTPESLIPSQPVPERAQQFTDHARQIVSEFAENPYQRALFTLTDLVTARDR